ncbi:MAG: hypothetical protein EON93_18365 [Burkholderiales bacterium]|nr:MAG: hypothetical protein EON93_18365 [Burkholderiales bacterium]
MRQLWIERWYPIAVACVAAAVWHSLEAKLPGADAIRDLYATTMGFAAITVGFLATAMSIVIAAPDSPLVRDLSESGYLSDLVRYLREPFLVGLAVAALCLLGFVVPATVTESTWFSSFWALCTVWLIGGLFRIGVIFVRVIEYIGSQAILRRQQLRRAAQQAASSSPAGTPPQAP